MSVQEEILLFCHPKPFYSFLRFSLSHPGMDMDIRFDKVILVDWPTRKKKLSTANLTTCSDIYQSIFTRYTKTIKYCVWHNNRS